MTANRWLVVLGMALASGTAIRADVESGPKTGEKVAALKVFGVAGTVEGKEADFTADRKDSPTVYLFVQSGNWDRPMARFLKGLDEGLAKGANDAVAVAVWLGEKDTFERHKDYLPKAQQSLGFQKTSLTAFDGGTAGPEGWGINPDAHLTVVVVHKGRVVKTFPFVSVNETDVKPVLAALNDAVKK